MILKFPYNLNDVYSASERKRFTVISTFSGGGGSSIGYKLAGGHVLLANEFVELAAETYRLNFPETPIIVDDIRNLTGSDFLNRTGLAVGELDVLDGSPPCKVFSVAGSKETAWGKELSYSSGKKISNTEDLFYDFIRITDDIKPKIFIAENVVGLQLGESRKMLNNFIQEFEKIGYVVSFDTVNAKDFGVAQNRPRTIIIGVREDIFQKSNNFFPNNFFPKPTTIDNQVTLKEVLSNLIQSEEEIEDARKLIKRDGVVQKVVDALPLVNDTDKVIEAIDYVDPELTNHGKKFFTLRKMSSNLPCHCLVASITPSQIHPWDNRKFTIKESYRIMGLPDDYRNSGSYSKQLERVGRMHSPFPLAHVVDHIVREYLNV